MSKLALLLLCLFFISCSSSKPNIKTDTHHGAVTSGYIPVNGINMYYETYGRSDGIPLVLIHGGGSTIESNFGVFIPLLEQKFRIIAVEEQAHGRTTDRPSGVSFEQTADDVASLLTQLNVAKANVLGFSNGGTSAMMMALRHPEKVNKLITASALTKHSGVPAGFWKFMKKAQLSNMPRPLRDAFLKVNPDQAKLQNMHDKDAKRMQTFKDIPDKVLAKISAPTLIMVGDQELIQVSHAVEHAKTIKGARLAVLPAHHGDYLGEVFATQKATSLPKATAAIIETFLED